MSILSHDHAVELCQAMVAQSPAAQTEVSLTCVEDRFVRYAAHGPTQNADREMYEVAFRVRVQDGEELREARSPPVERSTRTTCAPPWSARS